MPLEDIKQKLLEETENYITEFLKKTQEKVEQIKQQKQKEIEDYISSQKARIDREAEEREKREIQIHHLEMRKKILEYKQKLIKEIIQEALEKIKEMDKKQYRNYYKKLLESLELEGNEEILVGEEDKDILDKGFIEEVNTEKGWKLQWAGTINKTPKGIIVKTKYMDIDLSLETLLKYKYTKIVSKISKTLFG